MWEGGHPSLDKLRLGASRPPPPPVKKSGYGLYAR